jgi:hypothetical protein
MGFLHEKGKMKKLLEMKHDTDRNSAHIKASKKVEKSISKIGTITKEEKWAEEGLNRNLKSFQSDIKSLESGQDHQVKKVKQHIVDPQFWNKLKLHTKATDIKTLQNHLI